MWLEAKIEAGVITSNAITAAKPTCLNSRFISVSPFLSIVRLQLGLSEPAP